MTAPLVKPLALGLDFGTEFCRAVLVETRTGRIAGATRAPYRHGVITERLPNHPSVALEAEAALQHPADYLDAARQALGEALALQGKDAAARIVGVGVDFTACTMLPVDAQGRPLCEDPRFAAQPHAYVKLWRHHTAQEEADEFRDAALRRGEAFLSKTGGVVSSEWFFPKMLETARRAPEVYRHAAFFVEAGDWLVWQLTGTRARSACQAGYKAFWVHGAGYPDAAFMKAVDARIEHCVAEKIVDRQVHAPGSRVGVLSERAATMLGLPTGIPVSAATIDAHAGVPACRVTTPGRMAIVMGTSACHMALHGEERGFAGLAGMVWEGIVPGCFGYESGQSGFGDIAAWVVEHFAGAEDRLEAQARGLSLHELFGERVRKYPPGGSGLLALDWLSGNRSVLMNARLSGLVIGITLSTRGEDFYHAFWESCAFGTRVIIDAHLDAGIAVEDVVACGGIPEKSPWLMQLFADVCGRPFAVAASAEPVALGAAMFGAVAAGKERGGHDGITQAAEHMAPQPREVFPPRKRNVRQYQDLYQAYRGLYMRYGVGSDIMQRLREYRVRYR